MDATAVGEPVLGVVQERVFTAQGFRSRALETGQERSRGEGIVFVHGAPGSASDWLPLLGEVGAFGRALAFDLPGFGAASKPSRWDYSPDAFATFVAAALSEFGVGRAHLVMTDLGGLAGLHWAAAHPQAFASAVLINTGVLIDYRWHLLARLHRMPLVGIAVAAGGRMGLRGAMRVYGSNLPEETITRWTRDFDWRSRRALLRFYRAAPASELPRLVPGLARLDRPALVLWGDRDRFVPSDQAERQRESFPTAEIEILEDLGHYGHLEAPELIAERVLPFLRRQLGIREAERAT
jgi:pimeloyl-ACP methyl ester carboxylesterase